MRTFILILIACVSLSSCNKDSNDTEKTANSDYFAFGRAFGECGGENCAVFYKVKNNQLFADNMEYYTDEMSFKNEALSNEKYLIAKQIENEFPAFLTNSTTMTYGCPDCADQGGFHFEIRKNGVVKTWHIDTKIEEQPPAIKEYIQKVNGAIDEL